MRAFRNIVVVALMAAVVSIARSEEKKDAPATQPANATGTWSWSFQGFGGNQTEVTLKLKQDGEKLTGTVSGFQGQDNQIQDGSVKDGVVSFKVVRDFGGQTSTVTYTGKLSGDSLKGKSETVFTRDFDAKRAK